MQKVAQNGTIHQKLLQYMQLALAFAKKLDPKTADMIGQDITMFMGGGAAPVGGGNAQMFQADNIAGMEKKEHGIVENARSRSNEASQPDSGKVISKEDAK